MTRDSLMDIWHIENNFYLKSDVSRLKKAICQFEVFKKSNKVPGSILECGIFKGSSFIRLLTYRNLLGIYGKKVIGFDAFGKFPKQNIKEDQRFAKFHDKTSGKAINEKKLKNYLIKKKFKNFSLIKGNVHDTIPEYIKRNKNLKISFLNLDLDVYEPTKFVLDQLYKKVSKNGIILIDDFKKVKGATLATRKFLKKYKKLKIQSLEYDKRLYYIIKK